MWRVDALPTKPNLFKKNVADDPICPICLHNPETIEHVLWSCISAQDAWGQCSRNIQKFSLYKTYFKYILCILFSYLYNGGNRGICNGGMENMEVKKCSCLGEDLWHPPLCWFQNAKSLLEEYRAVNYVSHEIQAVSAPTNPVWIALHMMHKK